MARMLHEGCRAVSFGPREDGLQLASACSSGHIRCVVHGSLDESAFSKALQVRSLYLVYPGWAATLCDSMLH